MSQSEKTWKRVRDWPEHVRPQVSRKSTKPHQVDRRGISHGWSRHQEKDERPTRRGKGMGQAGLRPLGSGLPYGMKLRIGMRMADLFEPEDDQEGRQGRRPIKLRRSWQEQLPQPVPLALPFTEEDLAFMGAADRRLDRVRGHQWRRGKRGRRLQCELCGIRWATYQDLHSRGEKSPCPDPDELVPEVSEVSDAQA